MLLRFTNMRTCQRNRYLFSQVALAFALAFALRSATATESSWTEEVSTQRLYCVLKTFVSKPNLT